MEVAPLACCEITEGGVKTISSQNEAQLSHNTVTNDDIVMGSPSITDVAPLLPFQHPVNIALSHAPACVPPTTQSSSLSTHKGNLSQHHSECCNQRQVFTIQNPSLKTVHVKEVAGDDYCFQCLLACLYCQILSMCSVLGECLMCGICGAGCRDTVTDCCCCCLKTAGETVCTEEACQEVLDCGIIGECCCPSDCLEICLECCSICFPA